MDEEYQCLCRQLYEVAAESSIEEAALIFSWVDLLDSQQDKCTRNEYARYMNFMVMNTSNGLQHPFDNPPPRRQLPPLDDLLVGRRERGGGNTKRSWRPASSVPSREWTDNAHGPVDFYSKTTTTQSFVPTNRVEAVSTIEDPLISRLVDELGEKVDVTEFVAEVGPHTKDEGHALKWVMENDIHQFTDFVADVFLTWNKDLSADAAQRQRELKERYQQWIQRVKHRTKLNSTWLYENEPDFEWDQYFTNPKYIAQIFEHKTNLYPMEEEKMDAWRKQNFHRLYWLREQTKRARMQNDRLASDLIETRRKLHDKQTLSTMNRELLHEKNVHLQRDIKQLKRQRDEVTRTLDSLFVILEGNIQEK